jgi:DNA-binding transcriptional MerR regulator/methylmalonyl-CoA mutase cobalamin-binding subunit
MPMPLEAEHPIRVVANRTGLTPHVIRIWEKRYEAVKPRRSPTNRRFYTDHDIRKLILLRKASMLGRSIGQIAQMSVEQLQELIAADEAVSRPQRFELTNVDAPPESHLETCLAAVERLDSGLLESALTRASIFLSKPAFLERLVPALLVKIGEMWQEGSFGIVHEHLASSIIRTLLGKLAMSSEVHASAPSLIVSTPKGELHELGALVAASTAAYEGWRVTYLGPNLPAAEIAKAVHEIRARAVGLSIVYPSNDIEVRGELLQLRTAIPREVALIVGGRAAATYNALLHEIRAIQPATLSAFREELQRLKVAGAA